MNSNINLNEKCLLNYLCQNNAQKSQSLNVILNNFGVKIKIIEARYKNPHENPIHEIINELQESEAFT